jgi:hypothetical protein
VGDDDQRHGRGGGFEGHRHPPGRRDGGVGAGRMDGRREPGKALRAKCA